MKKIFLKLIGILILFFIIRKIDFSLALFRIRNCNLVFLFIVFFIQLGVLGIKVIKWKYILKILKIKVNYWNSLKAYWSGLYLGAITPGKVGDISRVYFLGKDNPSIGRSIFSVVSDRLTDVVSLLILGLICSLFYLKELSQLNYLLSVLLSGLGLCIWAVFAKREFFYRLFKKLMYKFISKEKLSLEENPNFGLLEGVKVQNYLMISFYAFLGWMVYFFGWWFLIKALYIKISFLQMIVAVTIATVISLMPITINGLGTRDATMIFIFSKLDIARESALSFSLLIFIIEIIIICLGVFFFLQKPTRSYQ